jgi:hypothetical protein
MRLSSTRSGVFDNRIHVTDIFDFCLRKYALAEQHGVVLNSDEKVRDGLLLTFKLGQKIEDIVVESLFPLLDGGKQRCDHCKGMRYSGPVLEYKVGKYFITGHVDIMIKIGDSRHFVEVKSINGKGFDSVGDVPILKHQWQLMSYLYLAEKMNLGVSDTGYLIYVCKEYRESPITVFEVKQERGFKRHIKKVIGELKTFSKKGGMPDGICNNSLYPAARNCRLAPVCFEERVEDT